MKGKDSWNALPIVCSSVTPVNAVAKMMILKPIKPTAARWNANPRINQIAINAWTPNLILSCLDIFSELVRSKSDKIFHTSSGNFSP